MCDTKNELSEHAKAVCGCTFSVVCVLAVAAWAGYQVYVQEHTVWHGLHQEDCMVGYRGDQRGIEVKRSHWDGSYTTAVVKTCLNVPAAVEIEDADVQYRDHLLVGDKLQCAVGMRESPHWSLLYTDSEPAIKECR